MRSIASRVNDALWNALMVEVLRLFQILLVFQQRGSTLARAQLVLIVGHDKPSCPVMAGCVPPAV